VLDRVGEQQRIRLFKLVNTTPSDCVVISGDITIARHLEEHLRHLAKVCAPRPVFFVPGNHDYHGSSIQDVDSLLTELRSEVLNLHYLNGQHIIPLGGGVCLIGHRGWADGRSGYGQRTVVECRDRHSIRDFRGLSQKQALRKMTDFGHESARVIRSLLPLALTRYRHVVIVTHVPPFPSAVRFNDKPCELTRLPHFVNLSAGMAILGIAKAFPSRQITVLAGHSHSKCVSDILPNLTVRVGQARTGRPGIFDIISF